MAKMDGFDGAKYSKLQGEQIRERIKMFDGKLYLELGGKLVDELHGARVLPGYDPNAKVEILKSLGGDVEIILCINANDIEGKRIRADYGVSYDVALLRLIDKLDELKMQIAAVVITQYTDQTSAEKFKKLLDQKGIKTYFHTFTKGYPTDVQTIVSDEGYGAQPYIETTKPLVVVASPGSNSGKLATCLAQLYHEHRKGRKAGYAKFETFPVWDLPLKHPVNIAYEASTADIGDTNAIDNFHLEKYGQVATNYNRDLAVFPILKKILRGILGRDVYYSPTDMGVNVIGKCITDENAVKKACNDEIVRRYLNSLCDYKNGLYGIDVPHRLDVLMGEAGISVADRKVVSVAEKTKVKKKADIVAIEIPESKFARRIITGKNGNLMSAPAAAVLNAVKELSGIKDEIHLISPAILNPILKLKKDMYGETKLSLPDVLIALAAGESMNPNVMLALSNLSKLRRLEAHSTVMLPWNEVDSLKKLGISLTCTDEFAG